MKRNIHFFSNLCQICREEAYSTCEICHLISYCCEDHRKDDWFDHSTMCRAIFKISQRQGTAFIYENAVGQSVEDFRNVRLNTAAECSQFLQRPLTASELEMLYWPKICGSCFKRSSNLIVCKYCAFEFACKGCARKDNHQIWCSSIKLFRDTTLFLEKNDIPPLPSLVISSDVSSMSEVLNLAPPSSTIVSSLWSEVLTYPLTLYTALMSLSLSNKNINIHIVGAEMDAEVLPISKWEIYFLHLLPSKYQVTLTFIGPDLHPPPSMSLKGDMKICELCKNVGKRLKYELISGTLFHDYVKKTNEKATLVTALNAGLYRAFGYGNSDSWKLTLEKFFAPGGAPVFITEYTCKEIAQDQQLIQNRFPGVCILKDAQINPFSSCKPSLNVISDDEIPVIFKNYYSLYLNPPQATMA